MSWLRSESAARVFWALLTSCSCSPRRGRRRHDGREAWTGQCRVARSRTVHRGGLGAALLLAIWSRLAGTRLRQTGQACSRRSTPAAPPLCCRSSARCRCRPAPRGLPGLYVPPPPPDFSRAGASRASGGPRSDQEARRARGGGGGRGSGRSDRCTSTVVQRLQAIWTSQGNAATPVDDHTSTVAAWSSLASESWRSPARARS